MIPTPTPSKSVTGESGWLTQLLLNPRDRTVQRDLRSLSDLHRTVMRLVPDGLGDSPRSRAGVLFRLEADGTGSPVVLVQTALRPATDRLPDNYARAQVRSMEALLAALRAGLPVRYRLAGNAVRRCGPNSKAGRWKQALPLHGPEADQWWQDRAQAAGLDLRTLTSRSADTATTWHEPPTNTAATRLRVDRAVTLFEGTATVNDPVALRSALLNGIGRSKSYGCGLLSIAPAGRGD
ncbi:type I-E CRISPR-associated protein Cas6/Cse3/CasE [Streptomyces sp. NBC_01511]|uniref:type I-E CRISPR-associated protein Cas6/Cse3/CasE n=1 Tax=Streptomyces sp. NBC_01511 TaxID=2903889 RepID=UPI00386D37D2